MATLPGKPLTPKQIAAIAERERKAKQKQRLHEYMVEQGIPVKTPEQRAADEQRREEAKAVNPPEPKPRYRYDPASLSPARILGQSGPYATTVAAFARANCARTWACDGMAHKGHATSNPECVIRFSMDLHIEQIWRDAGIVRYDRCALDNLKSESRSEVELVIAQTFAEWEAAGSPGLDAKEYEFAHRFMHGFIWAGALPAYPNCPPPAHPVGIFPEWPYNQKDEH